MGGRRPRVQFTSTHLDQGRDQMDKVAQASYLNVTLSRGAHDVGILADDMNTCADTAAMQILSRRWTDMFIGPPDPTERHRRRVDYVMARPAAYWRTIESRAVEAPLASDHQPVLVVLEWVGPSK
jgi:endonuclease/exonuclease/phosphatase family metal-dependent hydrolase